MAGGATPGRQVVLETGRLLLRPWRGAEAVVLHEPTCHGAAGPYFSSRWGPPATGSTDKVTCVRSRTG